MLHQIVQLYVASVKGLSREIWLYSFITLINRAGAMVIPFLSIYMTRQLGFSFTNTGLVLSIYGMGTVAGTWIGGKLTDKIGYFKTMYASLLLTGLLFFILIYTQTFYEISIALFLIGLVGDAFRPAGLTAISVYSDPENHTRAVSLVRLAINLGFAVGPFAGGMLAFHYGYNAMFMIDGITCIIAGLLLVLLLKEKEIFSKEEEKEILKKGKIKSPLEDRGYLIFLLALFFVSLSFLQLFHTLPVFLQQEFHMTEDLIGGILAMNGLIIVITELPVIYLLEKKSLPLTLMAISSLLLGLSFIIFNILPVWIVVPYIAMIIATISEIINFPFSNTWTVERSNPLNRGSYMGLYTMTFSIGQIFAPIMGLKIAEIYGFAFLWYTITLFSLVAFGLYVLLIRIESAV